MASYDELLPIEGTISELLASLKHEPSMWEVVEPDDVAEKPWNCVRSGQYEDLYAAIESGLDVNATSSTDALSRTFLMLAFQGRRRSLAEWLIGRGADGSAVDSNEKPTLFYSSEFLDGLILAKRFGFDMNARDRKGNNILHYLADDTYPLSGGETRRFGWLIDNGVDGHALNQAGDSPTDILNRKVEEFKAHFVDQPYMADYIPTALVENIKKLHQSTG